MQRIVHKMSIDKVKPTEETSSNQTETEKSVQAGHSPPVVAKGSRGDKKEESTGGIVQSAKHFAEDLRKQGDDSL